MVSTEFLLLQRVLQFRHRIRNPFSSVPRELPDPDPNPHSKYRSGSRSGCNYIIIMKKGHLKHFRKCLFTRLSNFFRQKKTSFLIVSSLLKNKNDNKSMTTSHVFLQIFGILSLGIQIRICK